MTNAEKIAVVAGLLKASTSEAARAMFVLRTPTKARDLKVGDIVLNHITRKPEAVIEIEKWQGDFVVTLDTRDDGNRFILEWAAWIDTFPL